MCFPFELLHDNDVSNTLYLLFIYAPLTDLARLLFIPDFRLKGIVFSDSGRPRCHALGHISTILRGANNLIDTTDKARGREGRKQLGTNKIYLQYLHVYVKYNIFKKFNCGSLRLSTIRQDVILKH